MNRKSYPFIAISRETTLDNKTGSWRTQKPVINQEKCNQCGICQIFCPDLAIFGSKKTKYEINYDYCKGCGICVKECPLKAIVLEMEEE